MVVGGVVGVHIYSGPGEARRVGFAPYWVFGCFLVLFALTVEGRYYFVCLFRSWWLVGLIL